MRRYVLREMIACMYLTVQSQLAPRPPWFTETFTFT